MFLVNWCCKKTKRIKLYSCSHINASFKTDICLNCLENTGLQKECILWQLIFRCETYIQLQRKNTLTVPVKLLINNDLLLLLFPFSQNMNIVKMFYPLGKFLKCLNYMGEGEGRHWEEGKQTSIS